MTDLENELRQTLAAAAEETEVCLSATVRLRDSIIINKPLTLVGHEGILLHGPIAAPTLIIESEGKVTLRRVHLTGQGNNVLVVRAGQCVLEECCVEGPHPLLGMRGIRNRIKERIDQALQGESCKEDSEPPRKETHSTVGVYATSNVHLDMQRTTVRYHDGSALHAEEAATVLVSSCTLTANTIGALVETEGDVEIENSNCSDNAENGIEVRAGAPKLTNNTCDENGNGGITYTNMAKGMADSNTCCGNGYNGIRVLDNASPLLRNNRCDGNICGVTIWRTSTPHVCENSCSYNRETGILVCEKASPTLEKNTLSHSSCGVLLRDKTVTTLVSNVAQHSEVGFMWQHHARGAATANVANQCGLGAWIRQTANPTLANCVFEGNQNGLIIGGSATPEVRESRFTDNEIGLFISSQSRPTIQDNHCWQNRKNGIMIAAQARPKLSDNVCQDNGEANVVEVAAKSKIRKKGTRKGLWDEGKEPWSEHSNATRNLHVAGSIADAFDIIRSLPKQTVKPAFDAIVRRQKNFDRRVQMAPLENIPADLPASWGELLSCEDPRPAIKRLFGPRLGNTLAHIVCQVALIESSYDGTRQLGYFCLNLSDHTLCDDMLLGGEPVSEPALTEDDPDVYALCRVHGHFVDEFNKGIQTTGVDEEENSAGLIHIEECLHRWVASWRRWEPLSLGDFDFDSQPWLKAKDRALVANLTEQPIGTFALAQLETKGPRKWATWLKLTPSVFRIYRDGSDKKVLAGFQSCASFSSLKKMNNIVEQVRKAKCTQIALPAVPFNARWRSIGSNADPSTSAFAIGDTTSLVAQVSKGGQQRIAPGRYELTKPLIMGVDIELDGNGEVTLVNCAKGVGVEVLSTCTLRGVTIISNDGVAIRVKDAGQLHIHNAHIVCNTHAPGTRGVFVLETASANIARSRITGFHDGIVVANQAHLKVTNAVLYENVYGILATDESRAILVRTIGVDHRYGHCIVKGKASADVEGAEIYRTHQVGLWADEESKLVARHCTVRDGLDGFKATQRAHMSLHRVTCKQLTGIGVSAAGTSQVNVVGLEVTQTTDGVVCQDGATVAAHQGQVRDSDENCYVVLGGSLHLDDCLGQLPGFNHPVLGVVGGGQLVAHNSRIAGWLQGGIVVRGENSLAKLIDCEFFACWQVITVGDNGHVVLESCRSRYTQKDEVNVESSGGTVNQFRTLRSIRHLVDPRAPTNTRSRPS